MISTILTVGRPDVNQIRARQGGYGRLVVLLALQLLGISRLIACVNGSSAQTGGADRLAGEGHGWPAFLPTGMNHVHAHCGYTTPMMRHESVYWGSMMAGRITA